MPICNNCMLSTTDVQIRFIAYDVCFYSNLALVIYQMAFFLSVVFQYILSSICFILSFISLPSITYQMKVKTDCERVNV